MPFPMPTLDERTFQDIVDEAKRRIPHHTPEWTDHNVSDPGVALIELFAWMTESIVYRLNQVPDRLYRSFLDLVGIAPYAPEPASTPVTFWVSPIETEERTVPLGIRVATTQDPDIGAVEFMTTSSVAIRQPIFKAAHTGFDKTGQDDPGDDVEGVQREGRYIDPTRRAGKKLYRSYADVPAGTSSGRQRTWRGPLSDSELAGLPAGTTSNGQPVPCFTTLTPGDAMYFGFEESLAANVLLLDITASSIEGVGVRPQEPPYVWEVSVGRDEWERCEVDSDTTAGLNVSGRIMLFLPFNHSEELYHAGRAFWLRVRLTDGEPAYRYSPTLNRVEFRSLGGRAHTLQASAVGNEEVGRSNGQPGQTFQVRQPPVLSRHAGERVEVVAPDGSERTAWTEVENFAHSGQNDRHYTWDSASGEISFGPIVSEPTHLTGPAASLRPAVESGRRDSTRPVGERGTVPDGNSRVTVRQRGAVPPADSRIIVTGYRTGGGAAGNVAPDRILVVRDSLPFIQRINNRTAATGGVDAETVENAKVRGPMSLVTGQRAVTAEDFVQLVLEKHPQIGRAYCRAVERHDEPIRIYLVRRTTVPPHLATEADFRPDRALLEEVKATLEQHRLIGVALEVGPADFRGVSVAAHVVAEEHHSTETVRSRCEQAIYEYVNPLTGGPASGGVTSRTADEPLVAAQLLAPGVVSADASTRQDGWLWGQKLEEPAFRQLLQGVDGVDRVLDVLFFDAPYDPVQRYEVARRTPRSRGLGEFVLPIGGLPVSARGFLGGEAKGWHQVLVDTYRPPGT